MTLTAYYQLRNTKPAGLGFELLTPVNREPLLCWKNAVMRNRMKLPAIGITGVQAIVRMRSAAR